MANQMVITAVYRIQAPFWGVLMMIWIMAYSGLYWGTLSYAPTPPLASSFCGLYALGVRRDGTSIIRAAES